MSIGGSSPSPDNTLSDLSAKRSVELYDDFMERYDPIITDLIGITRGADREQILEDTVTQARRGTQTSFDIGNRNRERLGVTMTDRQREAMVRNREIQRSTNVAGAENRARTGLERRELAAFSDLFDIGRGTLTESTSSLSAAAGLEGSRNVAGQQNSAMANQQNADILGSAASIGMYAWMLGSSRELKHDIENVDLDRMLDMVNDMDVVEFVYNEDTGMSPHKMVGVIAEDTDDLFTTDDKKAVLMYNFVGALVASVQQLTKRVQELEGRE